MDHRAAARTVARRLRDEAGDLVERVVLYGSVARDAHGPESDVDLIVVTPDKRALRRALRPIRADMVREGAPAISVLVFTPAEFAKFPDIQIPFYQDVIEEGETLVA